MRRADREILNLVDILEILDRCEVIRLAVCADDKPYIIPMNFAFETVGSGTFIYVHCASEGRKLEMVRHNPNVCFEADCSYETLEAQYACNWGAQYESVIGEGIIAIIDSILEKTHALDLLMKRYGFVGKPEYTPTEVHAVTILRIHISSITGKQRIRPPG